MELGTDSATVLYDPAKLDIAGLKQTITEAGYKVRGVREVQT